MEAASEEAEDGTHIGHAIGIDSNAAMMVAAMTPPVGDSLIINGVRRSNFRLHPVGYWGVSEGCITLPSVDNFYVLRNWLLKQKTEKIPGTNIDYYGTVTVQ